MVSFDNTEIAFSSQDSKSLTRAFMVVVGKISVNIALFFRIPIGWALRGNVFAHFCGGETIEECAETTKILDQHDVGTILDYSVEGKESEKEFESSKEETLETVRVAAGNSHIPFCVFKVTGLARLALLEKVNSNSPLSDKEIAEFQRVRSRVNEICEEAYKTGTPILIDAEESWIQNPIDSLATEMMEKFNTERHFWRPRTTKLFPKTTSWLSSLYEAHTWKRNEIVHVKKGILRLFSPTRQVPIRITI
jgi:proline dehydrogenase